ncbi:Dicer-like protein 1 [Mortierella sp. NVP85]|nr:Dicer-like protein 1 [Mortierella sp. NVP85]
MAPSATTNTPPAVDIPRQYQLEVAKRAIEGNVIAVADTGSGKTLISVLLLKHMVAQARQEAAETKYYITSNSDIKAEAICGAMNVDTYDQATWDAIFMRCETIVLTGQILFNILQHAFLKIEQCNLFIFDECHHAVGNHCYRQIMRSFYLGVERRYRPKIFGMTASPPKDKGTNVFAAEELERTYDSQIITASYEDVLKFSKRPKETVIRYAKPTQGFPGESSRLSRAQQLACEQLLELCSQDNKFKPVHGTFEHAQSALGTWCATRVWKHSLRVLREEVLSSPETRIERRIHQIERAEAIAKEVQNTHLDEDLSLVSDKLKKLVEVLRERGQEANGFCGIVFVERRPIAHVLHEFLDECKKFGPEFGLDFIRAAVLTGHGSKGDVIHHKMQLKDQRKVLGGFRRGTVNLLIATDVAEEGIDIDRCRLVIRFDIKNTLISHIQSRGRARDPTSEYIVMQEDGAPNHLDMIKMKEQEMRRWCSELPEDRVLKCHDPNSTRGYLEEDGDDYPLEQMRELSNVETTYIVESTGARVTFLSAVGLLHQYCASLPVDAYTRLAPTFEIENSRTPGEFHCWLTLPPNVPLTSFYSGSFSSKDLAKQAVAFHACKELHRIGALNDRLLPQRNKILIGEEEEQDVSDDDTSEDEDSNSQGKKSLKMYPVRQPKFWDKMIVLPTTASSQSPLHDSIRVHITLVVPRNQGSPGSAGYLRSLALLTANRLPQFDPIELFLDANTPLLVDLIVAPEPLELTVQQMSDLHQYYKMVYRNLYRKPIEVGTLEDGTRHIIAPLRSDADLLMNGYSFKELIDWDEVMTGAHAANSADLPSDKDLDWKFLHDKVLFEKTMTERRYFTKALRSDLTPASPIPHGIKGNREESQGGKTFTAFYQEKREIVICNQDQPLVEVECMDSVSDLLQPIKSAEKRKRRSSARFLVPELCGMLTVAASVLRSASWMVSVLLRLDGLLKVLDFLSEHKLTEIHIPLMLEAITTSEVAHAMNYQRLELLGDTFLKFLKTLYLYVRYPSLDEGQLTLRRAAQVSNKRLYGCARRLGMDRFIIKHHMVNPHFFAPPEEEQWQISLKNMADLMESTLGAAYLSGGLDLGLKAAGVLLGPLENIACWNDFAVLYSTQAAANPRHQVPFTPAPGLGNLSNVEQTIGYKFNDRRLLAEALTHATSIKPETPCYQRLEFLGDAVLDMLVARYWVERYPVSGPGQIHAVKAASINNQILGVICIGLGLHQHILHMSSELSTDIKRAVETLQDAMEDAKETPAGEPQGEFWEEFNYPKVLGDILESVIGAIYVDSGFGFEALERVFDRCIKPVLRKYISMEALKEHPVTVLSMRLQADGCSQFNLKNVTVPTSAPSAHPGEASSFWANGQQEPVSNPPQTHVVMIHGNEIASYVHTQTKVARREVAKKALELLDSDPGLLSRYCDCHTNRTRKHQIDE